MKKLFLFLTILTLKVSAADINQYCMTEYPTTSFFAQTKDDKLIVNFIHHNGLKYMPIHNGVITPNDLGTLQDRASVLADLGEDLQFEFNLKECEKNEDFIFNCFNTNLKKQIGNHTVNAWSVYSSKMQTKSFAGIFNYVETTIGLEIDGESYHLPMRYYETDCVNSLNSQNKKLKRVNKI